MQGPSVDAERADMTRAQEGNATDGRASRELPVRVPQLPGRRPHGARWPGSCSRRARRSTRSSRPATTPARDHRFALLAAISTGSTSTSLAARACSGACRTRLRCTVPYALALLVRTRASVVAVEWGYGLPAGYDRLRSRRRRASPCCAAWSGRSLRSGSDSQQPRHSFVVAARCCGVATVCLPHGLSIKLDGATNEQVAKTARARPAATRGPQPLRRLRVQHRVPPAVVPRARRRRSRGDADLGLAALVARVVRAQPPARAAVRLARADATA